MPPCSPPHAPERRSRRLGSAAVLALALVLVLASAPMVTATPGDLVLSGFVYARGASQATPAPAAPQPLAGAQVTAILCVPRSYAATTGPDGSYTLVVPSPYAQACAQIDLEITAAGYGTFRQTFTLEDLWAQPQREFLLDRSLVRQWLPLILKP